jgi:hypothetical protein
MMDSDIERQIGDTMVEVLRERLVELETLEAVGDATEGTVSRLVFVRKLLVGFDARDTTRRRELAERLVHHAIVIQIEGASCRLREHAGLVPENIRSKSLIQPSPIPPTLKRRGRPSKNRGLDLLRWRGEEESGRNGRRTSVHTQQAAEDAVPAATAISSRRADSCASRRATGGPALPAGRMLRLGL